MNLATYRACAESFYSELTEEYYRHYAGLKDDYELEPIYARYPELFEPAAVDDLRSLAEAAPSDSDERRRLTMLLDFAVEGLIGQATKELETELAEREARSTITVGGVQIGFRQSAVAQANEPDAGRREEIEQGRLLVTERDLNPLYRELIERQHAFSAQLGYGCYRDMCASLKGFDLDRLAGQTAAFSELTAAGYPETLRPAIARTLGIGLDELRRSDLPRFFRAEELDAGFPASALVDSFVDTMRGLGIEVGGQPGVVLDVEARPNKSPRAFCAPVRVPDLVYLVISPVGGRDDFDALFHEGGHTEHFAGFDPALPFEYRYLGDNAITETFAFLFEHLIENPLWLRRQLRIADPAPIAEHARAQKLVYLRRYAAKLAYELQLHGANGSVDRHAPRYAELLGGALHIQWPAQTYLADVDPGFYCACYLRAWALETHLRRYLVAQFGPEWFSVPAAGDVLRGLWREGQRLSAEELLAELTGDELDFRVMGADLGLAE